jgi:CRISPR/Cas system-associated protein Cas5 (RAMP superfamily)
MNSRPTYELPPVTTLQGLLYAALGRPSLLLQGGRGRTLDKDTFDAERDFRQHVQQTCRFGVRIIESGDEFTGLRKLHKKSRSGDEREFITYVTNVETLISPTYRMYVTGPEELVEEFKEGLEDPERLLYLGRSDDLVDIREVDIVSADNIEERTTVDCAIPGSGDDPTMLPVEADTKVGRRKKPSRVKTVAVRGGEVESYYETTDNEQFVFLT